MKKIKIIGLALVLCLLVSLTATMGMTMSAFASSDSKIDSFDVERIVHEIFGGRKIKTSEYLYGFNDSADYVYIDFEDYGYAVFFKDTMEMIEYSPTGNLPYASSIERKYYAGPSNYFSRERGRFVSTLTGDDLHLSKADAESYSQQISEVFSLNTVSRQNYLIEVERQTNMAGEITKRSSGNAKPDIDTNTLDWADPPGTAGVTYIPNASYFTPTNPTHGFNEHGTCGSVAGQLLLSYNNFYNDRRIIAPEHLNGGWNNSTGNNNIHDPANYANRANNPNVSVDPLSMTRQTTGSNNEFYNNVINFIEPSAFNCICTRTAITITDGIATITVTVTRPDGTSTTTTTTRPASPDERSSTNTTHTHNGSSTNAVRNGLKNLLGQRIANNQYTINSDEKGWLFGWSPISSTPIKDQINAGRPIIIGMSSNLGGVDHWVVGYGYQDYTYPTGHDHEGKTYSGYIVHFGWSNQYRIWVNESWCDAYITMEMHHTHNYNIITGNIIGGTQMELRCGGCGHRKVDSLYNIQVIGGTVLPLLPGMTMTIGGTAEISGLRYPVSGAITIPATITGPTTLTPGTRDVVSIGANAFAGSSITGITFATDSKIQNIRNNTFANCTQLSKVTIPASVTKIDYGAFSGCTSLSSLIISRSMSSSGISIAFDSFKNCANLTSVTIPWVSGMANRSTCSHTKKEQILTAKSYHWNRCTACFETFRESHTMTNGHIKCNCGYSDPCTVSKWTPIAINSNYHRGTCAVCGVVERMHMFESVPGLAGALACVDCGTAPGNGPIIVLPWNLPINIGVDYILSENINIESNIFFANISSLIGLTIPTGMEYIAHEAYHGHEIGHDAFHECENDIYIETDG